MSPLVAHAPGVLVAGAQLGTCPARQLSGVLCATSSLVVTMVLKVPSPLKFKVPVSRMFVTITLAPSQSPPGLTPFA
jgi:hypothetical protein